MNCPKCQVEIKDHPANACLDALFATEVMGWVGPPKHDCWYGIGKVMYYVSQFNPSTNIAHAMEGVDIQKDIEWELGKENGNYYFIIYSPYHGKEATTKDGWKIEVDLIAHTKELAITRALALWAMEREENRDETN